MTVNNATLTLHATSPGKTTTNNSTDIAININISIMFDSDTIPNEILIEIFSAGSTSTNSHLLNISLVSRRFHDLVATVLYGHVRLANDYIFPSQIQLFLRTLLSCPVIASYVRQLDVQWVDATRFTLADPDDLALFTAAAQRVPLHHSMASQGAHVALILHLLPTVQILQLKPPDRISDHAPDVIDHVLETHATLTAGLASVRDITLGAKGYAVSAAALLELLKLPCIRSLHLSSAMDDFSATTDDTGVSAVTKLSFGSGTTDNACLGRILAVPCALTHFSLIDSDGKRGSFNSVIFIAAMQRFSSTLQTLELRFRSAMLKPSGERPDETGTLGDLHEWPELRRLRCPLSLLLGRSNDVVLADVLPNVLTELVLDPDGYCSHWQGLEQVVELLEGGRCRHLVKVCVAWPGNLLHRTHSRRRIELTAGGSDLMAKVRVACRAARVVFGQVSHSWAVSERFF